MRRPLRPAAPSLGGPAGRPRNGPRSEGRSYRQARRPAKFAAVRFFFHRTGQPSTPAREGAEDKMKTTLLRSIFLIFAFSVVGFSLHAQTNSSAAPLSANLPAL